MKKQQAILFDLDGTLLNTLDDLTSSVNVTLQAHGFPLRRKEEIRKFLGNGSEFLMRSALPEGTKEAVFAACLAEYQAYYKAHIRGDFAFAEKAEGKWSAPWCGIE